jgi:Fe-S cluster assembly protein SufD
VSVELQERLFSQLDQKDRLRSGAWDRFVALGLPTSRSESYRHIRLSPLYEAGWGVAPEGSITSDQIAPYVLPESIGSCLVFLNGRFTPHLSQTAAIPDSLVVLPLAEAMRRYSTFLRGRLSQGAKEERDPFAALNGALHQGGLFLYLPPAVHLPKPLQILHIALDGPCSRRASPQLVGHLPLYLPRVHLIAGRGAEASLISTTINLHGEPAWYNGFVDFALEEGAKISLYGAHCDVGESWLLDSVRATLKRDARLRVVGVTDGGAAVRSDYQVALMGENAEVELIGGWMVDGYREAHASVLVDHQAPNCRSRQLFKGVIGGSARSGFDGKIYVHPAAQQTDAFQLNNNLIISDGAVAHSKPNLEIFADEVKASHGATVGQLSKEQLHYLRSRGISEPAARALLIRGFIREIFEAVPYDSLRERLESCFSRTIVA